MLIQLVSNLSVADGKNQNCVTRTVIAKEMEFVNRMSRMVSKHVNQKRHVILSVVKISFAHQMVLAVHQSPMIALQTMTAQNLTLFAKKTLVAKENVKPQKYA